MYGFQTIGRMIIIFGAVLLLVGVLLYLGGKLGLERIPGDIVYRKEILRFISHWLLA